MGWSPRNFLRSLITGRFGRAAGGLALANAVGQAIGLLSWYLIAKVFSKDDIGAYSVFVSYGAMILVINLLSYQRAVPTVEDADVDPLLLALLAMSGLTSLLVWCGFTVAGFRYSGFLALYTLTQSVLRIVVLLDTRKQRFWAIGVQAIVPQVLFVAAIVVVSLGDTEEQMLVIARVLAVAVFTALYAGYALPNRLFVPATWRNVGWRRISAVLRRQWRFSVFVGPSDLFNAMAYNLPVVIIDKYFGASFAGQYSIVLRFGFSPLSIIVNAVSRTYHGRLAQSLRDRAPGLRRDFSRLSAALAGGGVVIALAAVLLGPFGIRILLGPSWQLAETMIRVMGPLFGTMLWVGPLTVALIVFDGQLHRMLNQLAYLVLSLIAFGIAVATNNLLLGVTLFSVLSVVRYLWVYAVIRKFFMMPLAEPKS